MEIKIGDQVKIKNIGEELVEGVVFLCGQYLSVELTDGRCVDLSSCDMVFRSF